jgi:N-ethylmaleimide reductase
MWTDQEQLQDYPTPSAMTLEEIETTKIEYIQAAQNAMKAGFDGVELHSANGYLMEQFLSPISNIRTDDYGGNIENRIRFALEVTEAVANAIGKDKTGIRLSPYGVASDMPHYPEIDATYDKLSKKLSALGIAYIHLVDHSSMGAPEVPEKVKEIIGDNFTNPIIYCGGFTKERGNTALAEGFADAIAYGLPFINNPDLVERFKHNIPLSQELKMDLFYTADEKGYTDYPIAEAETMPLDRG